jgi:uncharacterized membrane protein
MWVKIFFVLWAVLLLIDLVWVSFNVRQGIYRGYVNGIISSKIAIGALWMVISAVLALNILAVLYYVPTSKVLIASMMLGFSVYFVFNATSLVMFKWAVPPAIGDTIWGTVLCGIAALVGLALVKKWRVVDPAKINPAAIK